MMKTVLRGAAALTLCTVLSACHLPAPPPAVVTLPAGAPLLSLNVKITPANPVSQRYYSSGQGHIITTQNGQSLFRVGLRNELFQGGATRIGTARYGQAEASSISGRYIACRYEMVSAYSGRGSCRLSDGALFAMQIYR